MKTPEEILNDKFNGLSAYYHHPIQQAAVIRAMEEYAKQSVECAKDSIEKIKEDEAWEKVHALEDDLHNSETENDKLLKINEMLNLEIKNLTLMRNSAEMRVKDLKSQLRQAYEDDGKNSSHIHSGGKGGWSL